MLDAILAAVYLKGGIAIMEQLRRPDGCAITAKDCGWRADITDTHNPYGVLEIGLESSGIDDGHKFQFGLALRHASSVPFRDHGQNSLEFHISYHPFRK